MTQKELHAFLYALESLLCDTKVSPEDYLEISNRQWKSFKESETWKLMKKKERERHEMIYTKNQIFYESISVL